MAIPDWKQGRLIVTKLPCNELDVEFNGQVIRLDRLAAIDLQKIMLKYDPYGKVE